MLLVALRTLLSLLLFGSKQVPRDLGPGAGCRLDVVVGSDAFGAENEGDPTGTIPTSGAGRDTQHGRGRRISHSDAAQVHFLVHYELVSILHVVGIKSLLGPLHLLWPSQLDEILGKGGNCFVIFRAKR